MTFYIEEVLDDDPGPAPPPDEVDPNDFLDLGDLTGELRDGDDGGGGGGDGESTGSGDEAEEGPIAVVGTGRCKGAGKKKGKKGKGYRKARGPAAAAAAAAAGGAAPVSGGAAVEAPPKLSVGSRVRLTGLVAAPELNGRIGTVVGAQAKPAAKGQPGRWPVLLDPTEGDPPASAAAVDTAAAGAAEAAAGAAAAEPLGLKPANLVVLPPPPPWTAARLGPSAKDPTFLETLGRAAPAAKAAAVRASAVADATPRGRGGAAVAVIEAAAPSFGGSAGGGGGAALVVVGGADRAGDSFGDVHVLLQGSHGTLHGASASEARASLGGGGGGGGWAWAAVATAAAGPALPPRSGHSAVALLSTASGTSGGAGELVAVFGGADLQRGHVFGDLWRLTVDLAPGTAATAGGSDATDAAPPPPAVAPTAAPTAAPAVPPSVAVSWAKVEAACAAPLARAMLARNAHSAHALSLPLPMAAPPLGSVAADGAVDGGGGGGGGCCMVVYGGTTSGAEAPTSEVLVLEHAGAFAADKAT